jgi:DNA sulfur modification protein DndE
MFTHIRTSKENREVVTKLTNRLNLGAENVIARIALAHSLAQGQTLDLSDIANSGGKEYSKSVLFGEHIHAYVGMVCTRYGLHASNRDVPKYLKMHIDDGLNLLQLEIEKQPNIDGYSFLVEKVSAN